MDELFFRGVDYSLRLFPGLKKIIKKTGVVELIGGITDGFLDEKGAMVIISEQQNHNNIEMNPDYLALFEREVSQNVPGYRKIGLAMKEIKGISCGAIQYGMRYENKDVRSIMFIAVNRGKVIVISCTVSQELFDVYRPRFFELVESLEMI